MCVRYISVYSIVCVKYRFLRLARLPVGMSRINGNAMDSNYINPRWFRSAWNRGVSTGPFARPLARSLAPLTHLLAPHCSLCSRAPLRSFARSLTYSLAHLLARSRAHGKVVYIFELNASFSFSFGPLCGGSRGGCGSNGTVNYWSRYLPLIFRVKRSCFPWRRCSGLIDW